MKRDLNMTFLKNVACTQKDKVAGWPTLDSKTLCTFHYDVTYNIPTHCSVPFISFFILWYVATKFSQKRYQVRQRYKWGPKEWILLCLTFLLCYNNEQGSKILNFLQKHLIFFHIMTLTMRGNELSRGERISYVSKTSEYSPSAEVRFRNIFENGN